MPVLTKYRLFLALFLASGLALAVLALYVSEVFSIAFFANIFFWSWRIRAVRCVHCAIPIAPPTRATFKAICKSFTHSSCRECGTKLD